MSAMRTWHKEGRGRQTDEQKVSFERLMAMLPDAAVSASLRARWDPMEVVLRDPRTGTHRWTIFADGYARPGTWLTREVSPMRFTYKVEVEVERSEGLFASRDDIGGQIQEALEQADPQSYEGENGGQYETVAWEVSDA